MHYVHSIFLVVSHTAALPLSSSFVLSAASTSARTMLCLTGSTLGVAPVSTAPLLTASGRPRRSVSAVNYAEAVDDRPTMRGGSGGSRKRAPPKVNIRVRAPKSIIKQIQAAALAQQKKGGTESDDADTEEDEPENASDNKKSKAVLSLQFGAAKKKQTGPTPKYTTNFVIACEQICSRDPALLKQYHTAITKLMPVNPAALDKIRAAMDKILDKRVVERVRPRRR